LHAANLKLACQLHAADLKLACQLHAADLKLACQLHASVLTKCSGEEDTEGKLVAKNTEIGLIVMLFNFLTKDQMATFSKEFILNSYESTKV